MEVRDEPRCFDSHYMKCVIDFGYLNVEDPDGKTETCLQFGYKKEKKRTKEERDKKR